jgi:hypothetical protein
MGGKVPGLHDFIPFFLEFRSFVLNNKIKKKKIAQHDVIGIG